MRGSGSRLTIPAALILMTATAALAERLPMRLYTPEDGLAHTRVVRIVADPRGFLWFCTANGLSRFDGTDFVGYRLDDEGAFDYYDVAEAPDGTYWIALWRGGLARLDPAEREPARAFRRVAGDYPRTARKLLFDPGGKLWIGTAEGLFVTDPSSTALRFDRIDLVGARDTETPNIWSLARDRRGHLWIATDGGEVLRRSPDGEVVPQELVPGEELVRAFAVFVDRDGLVWAGHGRGVTVFDPGGSAAPEWHPLGSSGEGGVIDVLQLSDGSFWFTHMKRGLTRYDGEAFETLETAKGAVSFRPTRLAEDAAGNLWVGTMDVGAVRIAPGGFRSYDRPEEVAFSRDAQAIVDRTGAVVVAAGDGLYRFVDGEFEVVRPGVLKGLNSGSTYDDPRVLQDRRGRWWMGTLQGLHRYPAVPFAMLDDVAPEASFGADDGLPGSHIVALFEARNGDVWIGFGDVRALARWSAATGSIETQPTGGLRVAHPRGITEDGAGGVWFAALGRLGRIRNGGLETFGEAEGVPELGYEGWFLDARGRLLVGSRGAGVLVVRDPDAGRPTFEHLQDPARLRSGRIRSITQDRWGRLYLGSHAGVTRVDEDGTLRHYSMADGLGSHEIWDAVRDGNGDLWFTTVRGVYRLVPRKDAGGTASAPPIRITALRVAGERYPLAALGETEVGGIRLPPQARFLDVSFGTSSFDLGQEIRFQYKLEGAGAGWSEPTANRTASFASLAPGRYRFLVRAVDADGTNSDSAASVQFLVLAPFWQRWWFVTAAALALGAGIYAAYRYRLARLVELERVRTRIATDLHDDIGSSLSRIAILSEVTHRAMRGQDERVTQPLQRIAGLSRELVDSMSDIVWAINPRRDRLAEVVSRMRRFAVDTLLAQDVDLDFLAPEEGTDWRLDPNTRRQIYLIFKESVTNAARHSGAGVVQVDLRLDGDRLTLAVRDDGRGFEPQDRATAGGHGLESMRRRAREIGGELTVESAAGAGTTVRLRVPLRGGRVGTNYPRG